MYLECWNNNKILCTQHELVRLYKKFSHPSNGKLQNLLKPARLWGINHETRTILDDITSICNACQRISLSLLRIKISLPSKNNLVFGDERSVGLIFSHWKAILYNIGTATRFSAATYLYS